MTDFKHMREKGFVLVLAIILIVFVAIVVAAITIFINQRLVGYNIEQRIGRCRYNSQAGLNYALYQYRQSGTTYAAPTTVTIDANNSAVITSTSAGGGGAAGLLQIDSTGSSLSGNGKDILGLHLTNTSSSSSIIISQMIIYFATGSRTLDSVRVNGNDVWTTNTLIGTSPVTLNISDVTIPASTTRNIDRIRFTSSVSGQIAFIRFIMSDSTTTDVCQAYPAPSQVCSTQGTTLTIRSMGRTAGSSLYKTVQATYTISTGNVSAYIEQYTSVP